MPHMLPVRKVTEVGLENGSDVDTFGSRDGLPVRANPRKGCAFRLEYCHKIRYESDEDVWMEE